MPFIQCIVMWAMESVPLMDNDFHVISVSMINFPVSLTDLPDYTAVAVIKTSQLLADRDDTVMKPVIIWTRPHNITGNNQCHIFIADPPVLSDKLCILLCSKLTMMSNLF